MTKLYPSEGPATDRVRILRQCGYLFLCWALYWVCGTAPLAAQPWEWADEGLYLKQAEGFFGWIAGRNQHWLGPYDLTLLAKTPGFAIWLAFVHASRVPLRAAEFAIQLLLPFVFLKACRPLGKQPALLAALVTVLLVAVPPIIQSGRLVRTSLQMTLAGATLIAVIGLILRAKDTPRRQLPWGALLGAMFSLCYLNREESVYLLPAVVGACIIATAVAFWKSHGLRAGYAIAACAITASVPIATVAELNYRHYGVRWTCFRRSPAFTTFWKTLTSLEPRSHSPFVPIPAATREKAYQLSPAFGRLKPCLEGPITDAAASNPGHHILNRKPLGEREFYVSIFEFPLRQATYLAGCNTAPQAEALWRDATAELKEAIRAKKIEAGTPAPGLVAPPMPGDCFRIAMAAQRTAINLLTLKSIEKIAPDVTSGTPDSLYQMSLFTNNMLGPTEEVAARQGDLPGMKLQKRVHHWIFHFERATYTMGSLAAVLLIGLALFRRKSRPALWLPATASLLLLGTLVLYCLAMGVLDVLVCPITGTAGSYTGLGFAPLSVLASFGFATIATCFGRSACGQSPDGAIPCSAVCCPVPQSKP